MQGIQVVLENIQIVRENGGRSGFAGQLLAFGRIFLDEPAVTIDPFPVFNFCATSACAPPAGYEVEARAAEQDAIRKSIRDRKNFRFILSARIGENQSCNRSANISLVFLTKPMRGNVLVTVNTCSSIDIADMASSAKI